MTGYLGCIKTLPALLLALAGSLAHGAGYQAGVARVKITPAEPMWMAGYAARKEPSKGVLLDLYAKALAVEDGNKQRLVIVTTDLIGIPKSLRVWLETEATRRFKLPSNALMLNASHTHCGPELRAGKVDIYGLTEENAAKSQRYFKKLQQQLIDLIGKAIDNLAPAEVTYTHGRAGFAMNRRYPTENGYLNRPYPDGPVDHAVPVLKVTREKKLYAIAFGYACHNTTLGIQQFNGDYAGFAQKYIEEAHPEAVALFVTGCGGDQNPQPRRTVELAKQHGRSLANGVESALLAPGLSIAGPLRTSLEYVDLDFADIPSLSTLESSLKSRNVYERRRAEALLKEIKNHGKLAKSYPYPVQVIRFGPELVMIALAGEVVVDYSLRIKSEIAGSEVWVAGYSNDVFAYIPSLRVLREGGYEGGGAMRYTGLPGVWAPTVEKRIMSQVRRQLTATSFVTTQQEKLFTAKPLTDEGSFTSGVEGPACDADGNLFAVNFAKQGTIGRVTPDGKAEVYVELKNGSIANGIRFDQKGNMYLADYVNHNVLRVDRRTRQITVVAHQPKMNQPNDLSIDANGVLYASDPSWAKSTGQLWRIELDGTVTLLAKDMGTTNGVEVSPDGKTLYVNESVQRCVWAFTIDGNQLKNKRLIRKFEDFGFDGMRCDIDGNLYITRHGKGTVVKMTPAGKILKEVEVLGKHPTNICFGGADGRTAYVTEAEKKRIVTFRVDRPGISWKRWARAK